MNEVPPTPPSGGLFQPMNEEDRIKLLKQEAPYCLCGNFWVPVRLPMGYIRQCTTCMFSASFCICDFHPHGNDLPGPPPF